MDRREAKKEYEDGRKKYMSTAMRYEIYQSDKSEKQIARDREISLERNR